MVTPLAKTVTVVTLVLWWHLNSAEAAGGGICRLPDVQPPVFCHSPDRRRPAAPSPEDDRCPVNFVLQCSPEVSPGARWGPACQEDGQWSGPTPDCGRQSCPLPDSHFLSRVDFDKKMISIPNDKFNGTQQLRVYPPGTEASYKCDPGFVLVGDPVRVCLEGRWSGAAPRCYLNAAERSNLAVKHIDLADGDTTTYESLSDLFNDQSDTLFIKLYFPTPIVQVRIIADEKFEGIELQLSLEKDNSPISGNTLDIARSRRYSHAEDRAVFVLANYSSGRQLPVADSVSVHQLGKLSSHRRHVQLYELQIVTNHSGLSWRQCLEEVEEGLTVEQKTTWAADGRCYHFIDQRKKESSAENHCLRLGEQGTLFRPAAGVDDLVIDMLSSVEDLFRHSTRSTANIWVHGHDSDGHAPSDRSPSRRCRFLSLADREFVQGGCGGRHPYVCQRAPRFCGRFPRRAGLQYGPIESAHSLKGATVNVTCGDRSQTTGQIRCLAPHWSSPDFCRPTLHGHAGPPPPAKLSGGAVGAVLGGVVGGVIVLTVLAVAIIRGQNGHRQRQRKKQLVPPLDNSSEFLRLNPNPIYGDPGDDDHLYSEVSDPDAIYEECSYVSPVKRSSPEPPPLPVTRPSVESLADPVSISPDLDYEVFPTEKAPQSGNPRTATEQIGRPADAAAAAPPVQTAPDYEPFPVEPQAQSSGETSAATVKSQRPPTLEYAVPLVGGKPPDGHQERASSVHLRTDVGPEVAHVSVGEEEAEYALPYRASRLESARRSIPDVAMVAMEVNTGAGRPASPAGTRTAN